MYDVCIYIYIYTHMYVYVCMYVCICMYVYIYIFDLYLSVFLCSTVSLVLSVCTRGLRVTQFQFSVCMYGTCGRIDNKADFDF